jgi:hypothetical protein
MVQRGPQGGAPGMVQRGPRGGPAVAHGGQWQGSGHRHRGHKHIRPGPVFGFATPYFYDYASPYVYDDECYEIRWWRGAYRRFWVCD